MKNSKQCITRPKESFSGIASNGYHYEFDDTKEYACRIEHGVAFVVDKNGFEVLFDESDFSEWFEHIKTPI